VVLELGVTVYFPWALENNITPSNGGKACCKISCAPANKSTIPKTGYTSHQSNFFVIPDFLAKRIEPEFSISLRTNIPQTSIGPQRGSTKDEFSLRSSGERVRNLRECKT